MLKLIKLEIKRNRLKTYVNTGVVITLAMLGIVYLFAAIPHLDPSEIDNNLFLTYESISTLTLVIAMACFLILSAVMYNRFIIEEYNSRKVYLLFSYPVARNKIFWAKVLTVVLFTVISMFLSSIFVFTIFFSTEMIVPLCKEILTWSIILKVLVLLLGYSIIAAALAVISLWVGYWKKSLSVTIVSSVIIAAIFGNMSSEILLVGGGASNIVVSVIAIISVLVAFMLVTLISHKVSRMEV